jgi:hypothetical protein
MPEAIASAAGDINSGSQAGMISNPRLIVGRKVESRGQQIIRAIFIFLTPPSTVNSQQSTMTDGAAGIDITSYFTKLSLLSLKRIRAIILTDAAFCAIRSR